MASFTMQPTQQGLALLAAAQTGGGVLTFTSVQVGSGSLATGQDPTQLTALINEVSSFPIMAFCHIGNVATVRFDLSNAGLGAAYYAREIGVFAQLGTGTPILYLYGNAGTTADMIPAAGGATTIQQVIDINILVAGAANVSATINNSGVYALETDFLAHLAAAGTAVHGLGTASTHAATDFDDAGAADAVHANLTTHEATTNGNAHQTVSSTLAGFAPKGMLTDYGWIAQTPNGIDGFAFRNTVTNSDQETIQVEATGLYLVLAEAHTNASSGSNATMTITKNGVATNYAMSMTMPAALTINCILQLNANDIVGLSFAGTGLSSPSGPVSYFLVLRLG